jgi:hypothetical protein
VVEKYLAEVEGELAEVRLGEAEQRAAGIRLRLRLGWRGGSGGGGARAEGAGERGCADVRRRGGHFLCLLTAVFGALPIYPLWNGPSRAFYHAILGWAYVSLIYCWLWCCLPQAHSTQGGGGGEGEGEGEIN